MCLKTMAAGEKQAGQNKQGRCGLMNLRLRKGKDGKLVIEGKCSRCGQWAWPFALSPDGKVFCLPCSYELEEETGIELDEVDVVFSRG